MLIEMFSTAANEKGVALHYICDDSVPESLITDE
jgi:hypothetical protein